MRCVSAARELRMSCVCCMCGFAYVLLGATLTRCISHVDDLEPHHTTSLWQEEQESETDDEEAAGSVNNEPDDDENDNVSDMLLRTFVYAHLPPSQRERDERERKGRDPPKSKATAFYQVLDLQEVLYGAPLLPEDMYDLEDPDRLLFVPELWDM